MRSQSASRRKKYVAGEPEPALQRLLKRRRRELAARERQYEETVAELTADLEGSEGSEESFWTAAIGQAETVDLLVERIAAADDRVLMVASGFTGGYDMSEGDERVADAIADALDRRVSVRLLMRPGLVEALPASVGERYRETLAPTSGSPAGCPARCRVRSPPSTARRSVSRYPIRCGPTKRSVLST